MIVAGHAVIAMGLAVILAGSWTDIAVAAVLGAGVGVIKQLAARRRLAIQVFLPVSVRRSWWRRRWPCSAGRR